jgi:hypothetical protein
VFVHHPLVFAAGLQRFYLMSSQQRSRRTSSSRGSSKLRCVRGRASLRPSLYPPFWDVGKRQNRTAPNYLIFSALEDFSGISKICKARRSAPWNKDGSWIAACGSPGDRSHKSDRSRARINGGLGGVGGLALFLGKYADFQTATTPPCGGLAIECETWKDKPVCQPYIKRSGVPR